MAAMKREGTGNPLSPGLSGRISEGVLGTSWGDAVKTPVDRGAVRDKTTRI